MCRQIGDTEVVYRVGNIASASNMFPVQASTMIKVSHSFNLHSKRTWLMKKKKTTLIQVSCAHPGQIYLIPEVRLPDDTRVPCTIDTATQRVASQSYLDLKLITVVKDDKGRKLDNYSSVELEWTLSQTDLGKLNKEGLMVDSKQVNGYPTFGRSKLKVNPKYFNTS